MKPSTEPAVRSYALSHIRESSHLCPIESQVLGAGFCEDFDYVFLELRNQYFCIDTFSMKLG